MILFVQGKEREKINEWSVSESVDDMSSQQGLNCYVFCVFKHRRNKI